MAQRPVFLPRIDRPGVRTLTVDFRWHPGFAKVQKRRCIAELHAAAQGHGVVRPLEISGSSELELGRRLSAFSLTLDLPELGRVPLECVFQAGKVFEGGGPFTELLKVKPAQAKRDPRLRELGDLTHFVLGERVVPRTPLTLFYDWLYLRALDATEPWLLEGLSQHDGFTDIHFNPERSLNCQASTAALYLSLRASGFERPGQLEPEELAALLDPKYPGEPSAPLRQTSLLRRG
jgi:hypothetical protein